MAILTVQGVGKEYGHLQVFRDVSFLIEEGERLALVGPNGVGKSTLMKGLAGLLEFETGRVSVASGGRAVYLSQDPDIDPQRTLWTEAETAFAHLRSWERRLRELEARMGAATGADDLQALMAAYDRLSLRFELAGGYEADARVRMVLQGLGFAAAQFEQAAGTLSGGQKVRLGLAKVLLGAPDLLLLDEPTNHLDLAAVEWLEDYLLRVRCSALIVSHDRYFMDRVAQRILEMERGLVRVYPGNYSQYLVTREQRRQQVAAEWQRAEAEAEELRAYIRRYGAGNRATQAHDRERKLERLEERMAQMERPERQESLRVQFRSLTETGEEVLQAHGLAMAYPGRSVFAGLELDVRRGQRVALVGSNGAGKTTLLKVLQGDLRPTAGACRWGPGVRRAYFSQDLDQLDGTGSVMDELMNLPGMTIFSARSLLARFLFRGDDVVHRPVAALSGGERTRLSLCRLVLGGANVLLLDEPTNHLDLEARQALESALAEFPGTIIFVSHDRYFIDRLATVVWEITDGGLQAFAGGYFAYRQVKEAEAAAVAEAGAGDGRAGGSREPMDANADSAANWAQRMSPERAAEKLQARQRRQTEAELRRIEAAIARLEVRKQELAAALADPETYRKEGSRELATEFAAVEQELERLFGQWGEMVD